MPDAKAASRDAVSAASTALIDLSHRIHAHPELNFEEERAAAWVAGVLSDAGFDVEAGVADLPTAFAATAGSGPLAIGICAEYDALPGIGHACGHNVIAAMGVGAGVALKDLVDDAGITLDVVGTPAEEGGGGKIALMERGAFDGVHAAMMVHPAPLDVVEPPIIAVAHFDVHYHGKEAHASAFPELGINAADAITVAQTAIGLLRQHIKSTDRIHGIVTKGGEAPNIVPAFASAKYYVRSRTLAELDDLRPKVERCFQAGATATGASLDIVDVGPPYSEMVHDHEIGALYRRNAEELGRTFLDAGPLIDRSGASTDMGNVSLEIPSIHPLIGIDSLPAVNHQPEFTAHCATPSADKAIFDGALAMAWTTLDIAADDDLRARLTARV
jgi:amidohydrolase